MNSTESTIFSNLTTTPFLLPFNEAGVILLMVFLIPLCVLGILGNGITIVTILVSDKLKLTWYYMILSLSASDLLSALISPLYIYRRTYGFLVWKLSDFLCRMFWSFETWTSFVTSIHILWFAALRFLSLQWPYKFKQFSSTYVKILIISTWIVTFSIGFIPVCIWTGAFTLDRTSSLPNAKWPACAPNIKNLLQLIFYTNVVYTLVYYIPFFLVIVFSIGIAIKIKNMRAKRTAMSGNNDERQKEEDQILLQLVLIVGSFFIGYIPRTAYHFYSLSAPSTRDHDVINWWFGCLEYTLLRITECLNPIFYNLSSKKMREETIKTLKSAWNKLLSTQQKKEVISITNGQTDETVAKI